MTHDLAALARSLCEDITNKTHRHDGQVESGLQYLPCRDDEIIYEPCPSCARIEAALRDVRREAFKEAAHSVRSNPVAFDPEEVEEVTHEPTGLKIVSSPIFDRIAAALERMGEG